MICHHSFVFVAVTGPTVWPFRPSTGATRQAARTSSSLATGYLLLLLVRAPAKNKQVCCLYLKANSGVVYQPPLTVFVLLTLLFLRPQTNSFQQ